MRRDAIRAVMTIVASLGACTTTAAWAQPYPTKPIRFIVGFGAGGGNDMIARTLGRKLTESLGQQVIVDNRPGSAGIVAAVITTKAPADGYTLFAGSISTLATNVSMYRKLPYDPLRDFAPVTTTTLSPYLCAVNPAVAATHGEGIHRAGQVAAGQDQLRVCGRRRRQSLCRRSCSRPWQASRWCMSRTKARLSR